MVTKSSMLVRGIEPFWVQKIRLGESAIFTKILNYTKFSCTMFCPKMYQYFHYTYCLQLELTYLIGRVSTHFGLEVLGQFGIENQKGKTSNIHKYFF